MKGFETFFQEMGLEVVYVDYKIYDKVKPIIQCIIRICERYIFQISLDGHCVFYAKCYYRIDQGTLAEMITLWRKLN